MTSDERETQAKQRFIILNVLRFSCCNRHDGSCHQCGSVVPGFPAAFAYLFIVLGLFEFSCSRFLLKRAGTRRMPGRAEHAPLETGQP
jgi:hypothetical protein